MESPKNTAQKDYNQNIAEKRLSDKIESVEKGVEKELAALSVQVDKIVQVVKSETISNDQLQEKIGQMYETLEYLKADRDVIRKKIKDNSGRISTTETVIAEMMETKNETIDLLNNAQTIFNRLAENEEKNHAEHLALTQKITNLSERQQEDNGKNFMYLYILFGLTIVAVGADIVLRLVRG